VCGAVSGVVVLDEDRAKGGDVSSLNLPPTRTANTGGGGRHFLFRYVEGITNRSKPLGLPHVDVRGEGGQILLAGSIHPETGKVYEWANDLELAALPAEIAAKLKPLPPPPAPTLPYGCKTPRGVKALREELDVVENAPSGARHQTTLEASCRLGSLAAAGDLDIDAVRGLLLEVVARTQRDQLPDAEKAVEDGLAFGARSPRAPALVRPTSASPAARPTALTDRSVLVPGMHTTDQAEIIEQDNAPFADEVLALLPAGTLYRRTRTSVVGTVIGGEFITADPDAIKLVVGHPHLRLFEWKRIGRGDNAKNVQIFLPCGISHASSILSRAKTHPNVRELSYVTSYPVFRTTTELAPQGYDRGILADYPNVELITDRDEILEVLYDLLVDFPFEDRDSWTNAIALLLTVVLRPAIDGNCPFFLVTSPSERSGKTKLVEEVAGGGILGYPTPSMVLPRDDDEIEKRLTALSIGSGKSLVHLDNLPEHVDSPAIASFVTCSTWSGRMLGRSELVSGPNTSVLVGTGNNVQLSGELAKRTVLIRLKPGARPEERTGFRHPRLREYIRQVRPRLLGALVGAVKRWGGTRSALAFGGFEEWSGIVGGVIESLGLVHLGNRDRASKRLDKDSEAIETLAERWLEKYGRDPVSSAMVLKVAEGLFRAIDDASAGSKLIRMGRKLESLIERVTRHGTFQEHETRSPTGGVLWRLAPPASPECTEGGCHDS